MSRWIKKDAAEDLSKGVAGLTIDSARPSNRKKKKKARLVTRWKAYIRGGTLRDFQRLCVDLGLSGSLDTKEKYHDAIKNVNVNIGQFLKSKNKPDDVKFFEDKRALVKYTAETNSFYPKNKLHKGDPLRALLKHMFG
ncbi:hypothetical protein LRP88_08386 [Fusarium phalaenopsidis]|nr:hypothetical protein NCS56_00102600 [Fusarium sp. Ph1]